MNRYSLFVAPSTLARLRTAPEVVLLLGGGSIWNFGDMLQLQGPIRQHRRRSPDALILPFHELGLVHQARKLQQLGEVYEAPDFVFLDDRPESVSAPHAASLGLVPLSNVRTGPATLHVFGGGFLNRFWGRAVLDQVESVLRTVCPEHYVISGQQIDPEFVGTLALHAQRWGPELVGCRDQSSVDALQAAGLAAELSGDDSFEEMERAVEAGRMEPREKRTPFALHMNLSTYTVSDGGDDLSGGPEARIDPVIALLHERFGDQVAPLLVNAYIDPRPSVADSYSAVPRTIFPERFPEAVTVDLAGALLKGDLARAARRLGSAERLITSSYHTSLFGKMVGIPTHLLAFNDYYRQKKGALGEPLETVEEFLAADGAARVGSQEEYLSGLRRTRERWRGRLDSLLADMEGNGGRSSREVMLLEQRLAQAREELAAVRDGLAEERRRREELESTVSASHALEAAQAARISLLESERASTKRALLEGELARHDLAGRLSEAARANAEVTTEVERLRGIVHAPPPLRHRVADAVNDKLKGGGPLLHGALKRALGKDRGV